MNHDHRRSGMETLGNSAQSRARAFAQALLGKRIPDLNPASNHVRHAREVLEFSASISDQAFGKLRQAQASDAQAQRERELLEWLALISDRHARELRAVQLREAEERFEQLAESGDLQEAQWDPAKHPRRGTAPNAGWFAPTQGAGSGSPTSGDASVRGSSDGHSASAAPTNVPLGAASWDANQEPPAAERKKIPAAPAVHSGRKPLPAQDVAAKGSGHHWVPQSTFGPFKGRMTNDAFDIFVAGTKSTDPYRHGFDTWSGVTHRDYIGDIRKLLDAWIRSKEGKLNKDDAAEFLSWIATGTYGKSDFASKHKKLFKRIFTWRRGFLQSIVVAHAAAEINPKLTPAELKAIAQQVVNGKPTQPLSKAAAKVARQVISGGKPLLRAVAKRILPGLVFFGTVAAAKRGWAGQGHTGDGAWGAFNEVARDLVIADVVEPVVFPAVLTTIDGITNAIVPGLNAPGRNRYIRRNGRLLDLETGTFID